MTEPTLATLPTPTLLLDEERFERNLDRMRTRVASLGARLRPHVKTAKSVPVARRASGGLAGPITVSTLKEAEHFFAHGFTDLLYAVGIAPAKLAQVADLRRRGADIAVLLDSAEAAAAVAAASREHAMALPALIEIDSDGHRAGVRPGEPLLLDIGRVLATGGAALRGVLTHAGGSYNCASIEAIRAMAEVERRAVVDAAHALVAAGLPCPVVSVGSTPTATYGENLEGVTEVRAGVYMFQDLVMAGIGVCRIEDIALSVLATVIGHQASKGWAITDAGWMAMSRDRGTARQSVDQGYGVVCDEVGQPIEDLIVADASQEHGIVARRNGGALPPLPIGTRLRILPNHACATAAQYDAYQVLRGTTVSETWPRFRGW